MPTVTVDFEDCCQAFANSYDVGSLPAMRKVEQSVLGCDYGGTSWTTSEQARQMIELLELGVEQHLLDIGAGSGWPALFLAAESGCQATLLDIPMNALEQAHTRAEADGTRSRVNAIAGSGTALPFGDCAFDVVSHSDVLCCLPEKLEMLKECRRVIKDGATSLFSVIAITNDLPAADHARAIEAGPPFVDAPGDYSELLVKTGWRVERRIDVTSEHRQSLVALVEAFDTDADLLDALGSEVVQDSRRRRQEQIVAIDERLLVREIFLAIAG